MRQYGIIGLGSFGLSMLKELSELKAELVIIDRDADLIERCKDLAQAAYVVDALDDMTLKRLIPDGLDVAIVDIRDSIESAILATNSLKKMGIHEIIVRADSEERGEVFTLVGATRVVYPDKEAALRIVPLLASPALFSYMPIGANFVMAEVGLPRTYVGQSLVEANLRQKHRINVVAIRTRGLDEYRYFNTEYRLSADDILLIAGTDKDVLSFSGTEAQGRKAGAGQLLKDLLKGKPASSQA
jgi:trk system potassium uptake protein TrkA